MKYLLLILLVAFVCLWWLPVMFALPAFVITAAIIAAIGFNNHGRN